MKHFTYITLFLAALFFVSCEKDSPAEEQLDKYNALLTGNWVEVRNGVPLIDGYVYEFRSGNTGIRSVIKGYNNGRFILDNSIQLSDIQIKVGRNPNQSNYYYINYKENGGGIITEIIVSLNNESLSTTDKYGGNSYTYKKYATINQ